MEYGAKHIELTSVNDEHEAWIKETTKGCTILELQTENFRERLKRVNSKENYNHFLNSGFNVIIRDDKRTIEETLSLVKKLFKLK